MPKPISESATGRCRWESETISWISKHDDKQNQLWNKICIARTDKWALTLLGYLNILFINNSVNNAKLECEMPLYRLLSWRPQTMHLLNLNVYRFKALPEALPHFLVKHEVDSSCDVYEPRNHEISLPFNPIFTLHEKTYCKNVLNKAIIFCAWSRWNFTCNENPCDRRELTTGKRMWYVLHHQAVTYCLQHSVNRSCSEQNDSLDKLLDKE